MLLHIFVVDLFAESVLAVNLDELVARHDTHLFGGSACRGANDGDGVADKLVSHADAFEAAYEGFVGLFHVLFGDVGRVRVEFLQCRDDGVFRHLVYIGRIDVEVLDEIKGCRQFLGVHLPFRLGLLGCHCHRDQAGDSQEKRFQ